MTEFKLKRHIVVPDGWYELNIIFDTETTKGNKAIKDTENQVRFIHNLTATEEPTKEEPKKKAKKTTKKEVKEAGKTEDTPISDLEDGDKKLNLKVRFLKIGPVKTFTKNDGTEGKLSKIDVENDSGKITLTAWDDQAVQAQEIKQNAWVFLQAAYVTEYKGTLELNVGNWSKMVAVYNG